MHHSLYFTHRFYSRCSSYYETKKVLAHLLLVLFVCWAKYIVFRFIIEYSCLREFGL
jgi:hypothetical protein